MAHMTLAMLLLASASLSAADAASGAASSARAEGLVTVRILSGKTIAASDQQSADVPKMQETTVRTPTGDIRDARLVEFE